MPAAGGRGAQVLAHWTVLVDCPGEKKNIVYKALEVQHILKIVGFRFGGGKPVSRNNFPNCSAYLKANLFITAQLSPLSKLFLPFESLGLLA